MNPAAPRDPVVTRVLVFTAGALFILNLCAFVSGLGADSQVDQRITSTLTTPPLPCEEVHLLEDGLSDVLVTYRIHTTSTGIDLRRQQMEGQAVFTAMAGVPDVVVNSQTLDLRTVSLEETGP